MSYQQLQEHIRTLSGYDKVIAEALMICAVIVQAQFEHKTFPKQHEDGVWVLFIHKEDELISLIKRFRVSVESECAFSSKVVKSMYWTLSESNDDSTDAAFREYCDQYVTP